VLESPPLELPPLPASDPAFPPLTSIAGNGSVDLSLDA
jgi:hypothetical protein